MRPGEELEALTEEIFRVLTSGPDSGVVHIQRNVMMDGPEGPREIDILMRTSAGPIALTTIIECKDHSRVVDITKVDALHEVQRDVKASKAVMVTRRGYSRGARQKAKRLGIGLYTAGRVTDLVGEAFKVPIYVKELTAKSVDVSSALDLKAGTSFDPGALLVVNDKDLLQVLRDDLLRSLEGAAAPSDGHVWNPAATLPPPWFVRDVNGDPHEVTDLRATYAIEERHLFGYLNDLASALTLNDEIEESAQRSVLFKVEDLFEAASGTTFVAFDTPDEFPAQPLLTAVGLQVSEYDRRTTDMSVDDVRLERMPD